MHILGKHMKLSPEAEEVATFFAKMLDHEYTTKDIFRKNFFKDWRKVRTKMQFCVLFKNPNQYILWKLSFFKVIPLFESNIVWLMQEMTSEEKAKITDLKKCNFSEMSEYFKAQSEARKAMTKEEKLVSYGKDFVLEHATVCDPMQNL